MKPEPDLEMMQITVVDCMVRLIDIVATLKEAGEGAAVMDDLREIAEDLRRLSAELPDVKLPEKN